MSNRSRNNRNRNIGGQKQLSREPGVMMMPGDSVNKVSHQLVRDVVNAPMAHDVVVQAIPARKRRAQNLLIEPKYLDTSAVAQSVSTSGTFAYLTLLNNGTTDITRIGDMISLHSIDMRWSAIVADATNIVRVVLIQWNPDTTIETPTYNAVFAGAGSPVNSPFNHDGNKKFTVVYDKRVFLSTAIGTAGDAVYIMATNSKLNNRIQFISGSQNSMGGLYLILLSDSIASTHPTVDYSVRINWYDA